MCLIIGSLKTFRRKAGPTQKFVFLSLIYRVLKFGPYMFCNPKALVLRKTTVATGIPSITRQSVKGEQASAFFQPPVMVILLNLNLVATICGEMLTSTAQPSGLQTCDLQKKKYR